MRGFECFIFLVLIPATLRDLDGATELPAAQTRHGYIARLLINEVPFPGERSYRSEADTRAGMDSILNVLDARLRTVPNGYTQNQIAATTTSDIIDVITAGGTRGQVDGFFRNSSGRFVAVSRVEQRVSHLLQIANTGPPGGFARIIDHATELATAYVRSTTTPWDRFARLTVIGRISVTGRAYSWMTAAGSYHPGGNFVAIPSNRSGTLGGNRFFTLRRKPQ